MNKSLLYSLKNAFTIPVILSNTEILSKMQKMRN